VLGNTDFRAPAPLKLFNRWPFLRRIPARLVGVGFRPEHVRSPNTLDPKPTSPPDRYNYGFGDFVLDLLSGIWLWK